MLTTLTAQSQLTGKPTISGAPIRVHGGMVNAIDYSHDGAQIVTASIAGDLRIWDAKTGKRLQAWSIVGMPDTTTFCGPKSERVVLGDTQAATLLTFDAKTGKPGPKVPGLIRPAASADGTGRCCSPVRRVASPSSRWRAAR